jgi:nucleoside 2-deoxyribosyltransferase
MSRELKAMVEVLNSLRISPFIFVDNYTFDLTQERQMMEQAMADIGNSDLLIAEVSDKGIGVGIEVGYAKAKGKPVIYARQKTADHSTTVSGISDYQIVYDDADDLKILLTDTINRITNS